MKRGQSRAGLLSFSGDFELNGIFDFLLFILVILMVVCFCVLRSFVDCV